MEKLAWKVWDEFLVSAWQTDAPVFIVVIQFLAQYGVAYENGMETETIFSAIGVNGRSPKAPRHLYFPVKSFFYHFFPEAGELLWAGKNNEALKKIRSYKLTAETPLREGRDLKNVRRDFRRKTSSVLPLIQGTTAISVRNARRSLSDWGTTKPPGRMRNKRL